MTTDKLEKLNCLARKIKSLKKDLETLNYIRNKEDVSLTTKDGRNLYEAYCPVRIPRSLIILICQEVQNKLEIELKHAEKKFEQEDFENDD